MNEQTSRGNAGTNPRMTVESAPNNSVPHPSLCGSWPAMQVLPNPAGSMYPNIDPGSFQPQMRNMTMELPNLNHRMPPQPIMWNGVTMQAGVGAGQSMLMPQQMKHSMVMQPPNNTQHLPMQQLFGTTQLDHTPNSAAPSLQMPPQPAAGGPIGSSTLMRPPESVGGSKPAKMHGYRIPKPRVDVTSILTKLKFRVEPEQWLAMSSVVHQGIVEAVQSGNATPNLKRQVLRQLRQIAGTSTWNSVVSELRCSPASGTKAPTMGTKALQYITPSYPAPTTTWAPPDNRVLPTYQYFDNQQQSHLMGQPSSMPQREWAPVLAPPVQCVGPRPVQHRSATTNQAAGSSVTHGGSLLLPAPPESRQTTFVTSSAKII